MTSLGATRPRSEHPSAPAYPNDRHAEEFERVHSGGFDTVLVAKLAKAGDVA